MTCPISEQGISNVRYKRVLDIPEREVRYLGLTFGKLDGAAGAMQGAALHGQGPSAQRAVVSDAGQWTAVFRRYMEPQLKRTERCQTEPGVVPPGCGCEGCGRREVVRIRVPNPASAACRR